MQTTVCIFSAITITPGGLRGIMLEFEKIKENWSKIQENVRDEYEITIVSYNSWIKPLEPYALNGPVLTVVTNTYEDRFVVDYLSKRYQRFFEIMVEEVTGIHCKVEFILPSERENIETPSPISDSLYESACRRANLNPSYTFDTFVVGANNKFAHAAALAVAETPAEQYNPLFIYGGVGLGKTHLMHSIAHFILKKKPDTKVLYITSETFTNELIEAIKKSNMKTGAPSEFREKYRQVDVLLIDDIQFIIGKESTQEEFFHTFNFLYGNNKQIIITSDKPPKAFDTLEERLRSRFEMGLTVDISSPDYETRMAILRKKEETEGYHIDNEIIKYIATNVKSNIRELEGALTKVCAYARLYNVEITLQMTEQALKDLISPDAKREVTVEAIIDAVTEHFSLKPNDIVSQRRTKEIVMPRQIVMYLCRELTDVSLQAIGKALGNRDHTTILHGIEKINLELNSNESLRNTVEALKKKLIPN